MAEEKGFVVGKSLAAAGTVSLLSYLGLTTQQGAQTAIWLKDTLGVPGLIMFVFNIAQGVALYFTVRFFAKRDDEKRADQKEAFAQNWQLLRETNKTVNNFTMVMSQLLPAGNNVKAFQQEETEDRPGPRLAVPGYAPKSR